MQINSQKERRIQSARNGCLRMRGSGKRQVFLPALVVSICLYTTLPADDKAEAIPDGERIQQQIDASLKDYQVFVREGDEERPLEMISALRWDNVSRGSAIGLTVLYVNKGRPHAACCIYPWQDRLQFEFGALSRGLLRGEKEGVEFWNMATPGAEYHTLGHTPTAAKTKVARLLQMKKLLDRFSLTLLGWNAGDTDRQQLRLMPTPLYRYEIDGEGVIDGAVFSYSAGVDPEALVVLELIEDAQGGHWEYAFIRRTTGKLEGYVDGQMIWTVDRYPDTRDPQGPFRGSVVPLLNN